MHSKFYLSAVLLALSCESIFAIPLGFRIGDGPSDNKKAIQDAGEIANKQLTAMQGIINSPNAKSHPAVVKAFGANANVGEIKTKVDAMANGRILVPHTESAQGVTQGATDTSNKHVTFGHVFYDKSTSAKSRAGTIIHEASHALAGTVDAFDKHGAPYPQGTKLPADKVQAGVQIGYKDSHLEQLKTQASHNMHHNADSYRVFAEECNVARSLYRRALENDAHPLVREYLYRRTGKACAWKPKGKAAKASTSAGKTAKTAKGAHAEHKTLATNHASHSNTKATPGSHKAATHPATKKAAAHPANRKAAAHPANRKAAAHPGTKKGAAHPSTHKASTAAAHKPAHKPVPAHKAVVHPPAHKTPAAAPKHAPRTGTRQAAKAASKPVASKPKHK